MEVLKAVSNRGDRLDKIQALLDLPPAKTPRTGPAVRNLTRRLTPDEEHDVIASYQAGSTLVELGLRYDVHRNTVAGVLERHGIDRRYRMLQPDQVRAMAAQYQQGASLKAVGATHGINAETVRQAFMKEGLPLRPRPGWPTANLSGDSSLASAISG